MKHLAPLPVGDKLAHRKDKPVVVEHDEYDVEHHDGPAHYTHDKAQRTADERPGLIEAVLDQFHPLLPAQETPDLVEIDIPAYEIVYFLRNVGYLYLARRILADYLRHLAAFLHKIGNKYPAEHPDDQHRLKKGHDHGEKPALASQHLLIKLYGRLKDVGYEACDKKREQYIAEDIEEEKRGDESAYREEYADHTVECIGTSVHLSLHLSLHFVKLRRVAHYPEEVAGMEHRVGTRIDELIFSALH